MKKGGEGGRGGGHGLAESGAEGGRCVLGRRMTGWLLMERR